MERKMKQVLVVDDSPVIRKIARRMLEALNLQTSEAADGKHALATCSFNMPDAILVDAHMPSLPGADFLKQLRKLPGGEKPKVVISTIEHDVPQIARAMHAGADDFLLKPFDREHVRAKFSNIGLV
jgi:two-component system, chemotaxis family, chemotaxis protein CheY